MQSIQLKYLSFVLIVFFALNALDYPDSTHSSVLYVGLMREWSRITLHRWCVLVDSAERPGDTPCFTTLANEDHKSSLLFNPQVYCVLTVSCSLLL